MFQCIKKGRRDGLVLANEILRDDKRIPVSDVIEVVRCKDCRLAKESNDFDGWYFCKNNQMTHKPTHFCSYGEREDKE